MWCWFAVMPVYGYVHDTLPSSLSKSVLLSASLTLTYKLLLSHTCIWDNTSSHKCRLVFSHMHTVSVDAVRGEFLTYQVLTYPYSRLNSTVNPRRGTHLTQRFIFFGGWCSGWLHLWGCLGQGCRCSKHQAGATTGSNNPLQIARWVAQARRLWSLLQSPLSFSVPSWPEQNSG